MPDQNQKSESIDPDQRVLKRKAEVVVRPLVIEVPVPVRPLEVEREGDGPQKPDYSWRRKAKKRRLQAARGQTESDPAEKDFVPIFAPPRHQDGSPQFELSAEQLSGRVVNTPGEPARQRERTALVSGCTFALLLTVMAGTMFADSGNNRTPGSLQAVVESERRIWAEVQRNTRRVPQAIAAVEDFFRARTPEEKINFVRGGSAMLPALRYYYQRHPDEPDGFESARNVDFGYHGGRDFILVHGTDSQGANVETMVEDTPDGMKLDWRFLTGAGEVEWDEWISERPARPVSLRVEAVLDDYYSGAFADRREWLCLRITDAADTSAAWAYLPRSSDDGLTIFRQLNRRSGPVRMLGSFSFSTAAAAEKSPAPQVSLLSVADQGWLDRSPEVSGEINSRSDSNKSSDPL